MKSSFLFAFLLAATFSFAQPAEKKLYIVRPYRFGYRINMKLLVNGRIVRVPNRSIVEIPVTNDSIRIRVLNPQFRKRAQTVQMGAMSENYFLTYFSATRGLFPRDVVRFQQMAKDDCFETTYKRYKVRKLASL